MGLNILFLSSAHNGLSQRALVELGELGHQVTVQVANDGDVMCAAVERVQPDLIIAPMLKAVVPDEIWRNHTCLIVHPGIVGDRGPSSLDWAIVEGEKRWGVTVLQAAFDMDAGDIWATAEFPMRQASKSELYRHEVTDAALRALLMAVERFASGTFRPRPLDYSANDVRGRLRPTMRAADRAVDWNMTSEQILLRVRSADSAPGVRAELAGLPCHLFGVHPEARLTGTPGELLGRRDGAVCVATADGAVWISHLKAKDGFKLPAALVLGDERLGQLPTQLLPLSAPASGFREIHYRESGAVGFLHFDFANGAMSTAQCEHLRAAYLQAKQRPTRVIVLMGGNDMFSNGIHLNMIEAADDPAQESWLNINAMNDLVREIVLTDSHITVSALQGNAGAGGVILALAADHVWAKSGSVLNPHYKGMGGLYGSEYWTYLLPQRVGAELAVELTDGLAPLGTQRAERIGLIDAQFGDDFADFATRVEERAQGVAESLGFDLALEAKALRRAADERQKPLEAYRAEELAHMHENFFGADRGYHKARTRFVRKITTPAAANDSVLEPLEVVASAA